MADNTTLNLGSGGDVIATDDIAGVKHQLVKIEYGIADSATPVSTTNPLPVVLTGATQNVTNAGTFATQATLAAETTKVIGTVNISAAQTIAAVTAITNALPAGTNAIGKLSANGGVTIGDVNVISQIPGTGATNLGKAEDAPHTSGDTGILAMGVRQDADASPVSATGDYQAFLFDASGNLKVNIKAGAGSGGTALADAAAFTRGTTSVTPVAGVVETSAPTLTNGNTGALSLTTAGALRVDVSSGSIPGFANDAAMTIGTSTAAPIVGRASAAAPTDVSADNDAVQPWCLRSGAIVNQPSYAGVLATTGNGVSGTGVPRVTIASDSTGRIAPAASASGGASLNSLIAPATPAKNVITSAASQIYSITCFNLLATPVYLKIWDNVTGSVTLGTTACNYQYMIPGNTAGAGFTVEFPVGLAFATGIITAVTSAISTTDNTSTTANSVIVNVSYK